MANKKYKMVPIDSIVAIEEFNTRTKGPGDLTALSENIKAVGVLEPLLGKDKENGKNEVEIHAGFRRLAAAKLAGLTEVPVILVPRRRITRKQMLLENVAENIHRDELNPMDEALAFQRLHEEHQMSIDDVSLELGIKKGKVKERFKLLKLSQVIREAVHEDRISLASAFEISKLPVDYHPKYVKVAEGLRGEKLSKMVDKELDKISKQAQLAGTEGKGEEPPENPSAGVTENVRTIRQCTSVVTKALNYDEEELKEVKDVNYRALEPDHLKTVAKLFDGMADLIPEETDMNKNVEEEVTTVVEGGLKNLDTDSPVVRQLFVSAILSRCKDLAVEKAAGTTKRARVTFVLAREVLDELFPPK
jgi:ParB family chromosome partitioning protein